MLLTHLSPPPAVSVPLCKGPNCCTSLEIKLPTPPSQNNPQGCHYAWHLFSLLTGQNESITPKTRQWFPSWYISTVFMPTAGCSWWQLQCGGSISLAAAAAVVALLWWLSAVESLLTLGSVASCSFISMLTYFVRAEGHGNRTKINISYMPASSTPLPLIMLLKKEPLHEALHKVLWSVTQSLSLSLCKHK